MNRFRLATSATLAGVLLAAGCASPCGCGGGFRRMSMFRARRACPCECCSSCGGCGGGGVPAMAASQMFGDGPILEPPTGPPLSSAPPLAQITPTPMESAPLGSSPLPPTLGAPSGPSAVPPPDRFSPVPAPVTPAQPSSRKRKK